MGAVNEELSRWEDEGGALDPEPDAPFYILVSGGKLTDETQRQIRTLLEERRRKASTFRSALVLDGNVRIEVIDGPLQSYIRHLKIAACAS